MAGLDNFNETIFDLLQKQKNRAQSLGDLNILNKLNKFNFTGIPDEGETAEEFLEFFKADTEGQNDIKNLQKLSSYGLANKLPEDLLKSINEKLNAFLTGQGTLQYEGQQLTQNEFTNLFESDEKDYNLSEEYEKIIKTHSAMLAAHDRSIDGLYKLYFERPINTEQKPIESTGTMLVKQGNILPAVIDPSKTQALMNIEKHLKQINKRIRNKPSKSNNILTGLKKYIGAGFLIKEGWPLIKRAVSSSYDVQLAGDTWGYVKGIGKGILSPYTTYNDIIQERTTLAKNKEDFALTGTDNNYKWLSMVGATAYDNPDEIKRKADVFIKSQGISDLGGQALYEHLGIGETAKADNTSTGENWAQVIAKGIELGLTALGIVGLLKTLGAIGVGAAGGAGKGISTLIKSIGSKSILQGASKIFAPLLAFTTGKEIGDKVINSTYGRFSDYSVAKEHDKRMKRMLERANTTASNVNKSETNTQEQNINLTINIDTPFRELNDEIERVANDVVNEYGLAR